HDQMMRGRDPLATLRTAEEDFNAILQRRQLTAALAPLALVFRYRGIFHARGAQDPLADFAASEAQIARALALDPGLADQWAERARTRTRRAAWRWDHGDEAAARADLQAAEADFTQSLRLNPNRPEAWTWRGDARAQRAVWAARRGEPAQPLF